jgi:hypothetical protein
LKDVKRDIANHISFLSSFMQFANSATTKKHED